MTANSLAVVEKFVNQDDLSYRNDELPEKLLASANYLQMDVLQNDVLQVIRKKINNLNCVTYYNDFCVNRGILKLESFIMSTIIRPAEAARRRKYGRFDLVIKLQQFPFKCHKAILSSASEKIKRILNQDATLEMMEGKDLGLTRQDDVQLAYSLFEQIYLNEESFGTHSMKESLQVLKLITVLDLTDHFYQSKLEDLCRHVSVSNVGECYQAGVEMGQTGVVNIALQFLAYKIQDPSLESLFLALTLQHVSEVLSSSRLNVPDELTVGKLALKWMEAQEKVILILNCFSISPPLYCLQPWLDLQEVLQGVRWSRLSYSQTESLLSSQPQLRELLPQLTDQPDQRESLGRGWPQQLLLVASLGSQLSLHCYDLERKCWSVLASKQFPSWMKFSGAAQISEGEGRLVFSQVNSDSPFPFTMSFYNIWEDSWSFPNEVQTPVKATKECQPQSLVSVNNEVFTVLADGKQGRAVLYGASRLSSPSPLYITYGPSSASTEKFKTGEKVSQGDLVSSLLYVCRT